MVIFKINVILIDIKITGIFSNTSTSNHMFGRVIWDILPSAFFKVSRNVRVIYPKNRPNQTTNYWLITSRVHKVPFHFFDKLKYEIRNKILILVSILKLRGIKHQTKWFFHFQNNWALYLQIWSSFSIFHLNLKNGKPNYLNK